MEGVTLYGAGTAVLSDLGTRKRATSLEPPNAKRARAWQYDGESGSGASDHELSEDFSPSEHDNEAGSSAATLLTPVSWKSSPRHPSDVNKYHHCPYDDCKKSFNRPAKLAQHIRSHTNTRPFVCPHGPCTKDFLRDSHLKHHVKSAHSGVRDYICEWEGCKKRFITATRLRRHHAAHEGREKFRCTIAGCGHTFRKHGTLQRHIITIHQGRDPFECGERDNDGQKCAAGFDTEGKLKSHIGRVHSAKSFVCTLCTLDNDGNDAGRVKNNLVMVFPSHAALQAHMNSEHPPTCPECGLKCTSQSALKSHTEVIHGDLSIDKRRTHICPEPQCGQGFTKKGNLNAHIQISHAGKRFVCGVVDPKTLNNVDGWDGSDACGEPSTSKRNLERHIRGAHLGLESSSKTKKKGKRGNAETIPPSNEVPILTRLTGSGYDTQSGRQILCLIHGCQYRFTRDYDLEIHLQSRHGLADLEIQGMLAERDFHSQITLQRLPKAGAEQGFGAASSTSTHLGYDVEMNDYDKSLEVMLNGGGDFWLGGQASSDERPHGKGRMRHAGVGDKGEVEMLDPSLR